MSMILSQNTVMELLKYISHQVFSNNEATVLTKYLQKNASELGFVLLQC